MAFYGFLSVGIGSALGAWLRWWLSLARNSTFPTLPLGTLAAFGMLTVNLLKTGES